MSRFRDGVDLRPLPRCETRCTDCGRLCHLAESEDAIRRAGWLPIEDAPIGEGVILEGLTIYGRIVRMRYLAIGDYQDRWVDPAGAELSRVTHFRRITVDRLLAH